jgi:hypothetical protein
VGQLTANEAAGVVAAQERSSNKAGAGSVMPMSGIPAYQMYISAYGFCPNQLQVGIFPVPGNNLACV